MATAHLKWKYQHGFWAAIKILFWSSVTYACAASKISKVISNLGLP